MAFSSEFIEIPLAEAHTTAERMQTEGARFVQVHAVNGEDGVDLYYTYDIEGTLTNYKVVGITKDDVVPSISDVFLAAFVFENEARELFGIDLRDIAIDFGGNMYTLAETEPMTYLSPELAAAKAKARAAEAAKAAKAAKQKAESEGGAETPAKADADAKKAADLEAKLASMDPEKAAKFRAAMEAKAAKQKMQEEAGSAQATKADDTEEAAQKAAKLEAKLASMDPEKAAKFRAAMEAKAAREAAAAAAAAGEEGE